MVFQHVTRKYYKIASDLCLELFLCQPIFVTMNVWPIDFPLGLEYNEKQKTNLEGCAEMNYLSIKQTAEKWNISHRWISDLCVDGRIPGATKIGSYWAIPEDAEKPKDERIKSGRYVKWMAYHL